MTQEWWDSSLSWELIDFARPGWQPLPVPALDGVTRDNLNTWYGANCIEMLTVFRYYDRRVQEVNQEMTLQIMHRCLPGLRHEIAATTKMWVTQMDVQVCFPSLTNVNCVAVGLLEMEDDFVGSTICSSLLPPHQVSW